MGKLKKQQAKCKPEKEKKSVQQETMGKYFYDLSKLTFAALVLGGTVSFFQGTELKWATVVAVGLVIAIFMAFIGNNILK